MKIIYLSMFVCVTMICPINNCLAGMDKDQKEEGCEKGVQLVCYCIPFDILTRYPYGIKDVKSKYHYKVNVSSSGFVDYYDVVSLSSQIGEGDESDSAVVNLRLVCEVIENGKIVVTIGFGADKDSILVDGKAFVQNEKANELFDIVKKYVPILMVKAKGSP